MKCRLMIDLVLTVVLLEGAALAQSGGMENGPKPFGIIERGAPVEIYTPTNQNRCSAVDNFGTDPFYRNGDLIRFVGGGWTCQVDFEDRLDPQGAPALCIDYGVVCRDEEGNTYEGVRCLTDECGPIGRIA